MLMYIYGNKIKNIFQGNHRLQKDTHPMISNKENHVQYVSTLEDN
jgi:hypothetical protein